MHELLLRIAQQTRSASVRKILARAVLQVLTLLLAPRLAAHALEGSSTIQLLKHARNASPRNTLLLEFLLPALIVMDLASSLDLKPLFA